MASATIASMDAVLKQHYMPLRVENMVYSDEPFLAWLPKYTKFGGKNLPVPVQYGVTKGRSAAFATAQANAAPSSFEDFVLTRVKDYSVAHIDNETMEASMGDKNAFLQATVTEINGAIRAITRSLASALPRSGSGSIGRLTGTPSTTLTLANTADIANFEVGMTLVASDTTNGDGGVLLDAGASTVEITDIDRDAGTMTVTPDASGLTTAWATGDYLYVQGDAQNNSTALKVSGLEAWFPSTAPTSTSFFGVDRTSDVTRLGGIRYDGSSQTIEEGLKSCAARVHREGGRPTNVWMNPEEWVKLEKELAGRVRYDVVRSSNGKMGFKVLTLATSRGEMKVGADHNFPMGKAYMLQRDTVKLYSLGKAPKILTYGDGAGRYLRISDEDGVEVRVGYYAQFGCRAPGYNAVITLPS